MTRERTERTAIGRLERVVAIPAIVGALVLGVAANGAFAREAAPATS